MCKLLLFCFDQIAQHRPFRRGKSILAYGSGRSHFFTEGEARHSGTVGACEGSCFYLGASGTRQWFSKTGPQRPTASSQAPPFTSSTTFKIKSFRESQCSKHEPMEDISDYNYNSSQALIRSIIYMWK